MEEIEECSDQEHEEAALRKNGKNSTRQQDEGTRRQQTVEKRKRKKAAEADHEIRGKARKKLKAKHARSDAEAKGALEHDNTLIEDPIVDDWGEGEQNDMEEIEEIEEEQPWSDQNRKRKKVTKENDGTKIRRTEDPIESFSSDDEDNPNEFLPSEAVGT